MDIHKEIKEFNNFRNLDIIKTIGLLASFIGLLRFIPLIYHIYNTKKTNNFTPTVLLLALMSSLFWLIFGFYENSTPVLISSIIALFVYSYILSVKIIY
tara:strand:+ start:2692 stop:2988 length:297 start_codon:yes stop_codon:yes gene_type:complete